MKINKLSNIRGMHDLIDTNLLNHHELIKKFIFIANKYNFIPISTPIMEYSEVFIRTLGNTTDVVMKEMYSFKDKSGDSITLRPEGTAGIARAIISNGLTQNLPLKLYYFGPMFRYERPQKGRLRQFNQLGIEMFSNSSYDRDFEVINLAEKFLSNLSINKNLMLQINNLGSFNCRSLYKKSLTKYYFQNKKKLSKDSLIRLEQNPLRILDSKDPDDIEVNYNAPTINNYTSKESKSYFCRLKQLLKSSNINFCENPFLVRGLDYYSNSIFEYTLKDNKKYALLAGGSYDNLVKDLGGNHISGIGWAAGIERLINLVNIDHKKNRLVLILPMEENYISNAYTVRESFFNLDIKSEVILATNLKKALKYANKINAEYAIIIGKDEIEKSIYSFKKLINGEQFSLSLENIIKLIKDD